MPAAMVGHSVGEYVAACLAGVFSLEDGLRLIAARGRLIQAQPAGSMLVVMAPEATVLPLLREHTAIAAVNAPAFCVVSGPQEAIASLEMALQAKGITTRPLRTSHAFHSAMMEPVIAPFLVELQQVRLHAPRLPYASNVHGGWVAVTDATNPDYWARHLRGAVRFADNMATLLTRPELALLEVGPGTTLTTLGSQHGSVRPGHVFVASLPMGRDAASDTGAMLTALGRLWQAGVEVDWELFHAGEERRRVPLPTYPFERKRYFVDALARAAAIAAPPLQVAATPVVPPMATAGAPRVAPDSRRAAIVDQVTACLSELSGVSAAEICATATFMEMGFDSLFLSRVSRGLEIAFGLPVSFQQLASGLSTPAAIAAFLDAQLPPDWHAGQGNEESPGAPVGSADTPAQPTARS
jgi:acyl transferase domain-containing protein